MNGLKFTNASRNSPSAWSHHLQVHLPLGKNRERKHHIYIHICIYMLVVDTVTQTHIVNAIQFIKYNNQYLVRLCGVAGLDCITTKAEWGDGG